MSGAPLRRTVALVLELRQAELARARARQAQIARARKAIAEEAEVSAPELRALHDRSCLARLATLDRIADVLDRDIARRAVEAARMQLAQDLLESRRAEEVRRSRTSRQRRLGEG